MTAVVTTGKVGVVRASRKRVTSLIAPPGSRCCGRVVNTCVALQTGGATARLRRYAVRHGACASVRCESCHRFSSLFGQPNLSCPARARDSGGDVGAVRDRWSTARPGEKRWATTSCESRCAHDSADAPRSARAWPERFGAAISAPPGRSVRVGRIPDGSREVMPSGSRLRRGRG